MALPAGLSQPGAGRPAVTVKATLSAFPSLGARTPLSGVTGQSCHCAQMQPLAINCSVKGRDRMAITLSD